MGQQQLLLIVLGVITVGIAVIVGINLFNESSRQNNRDAMIIDLQNLAMMAQAHYKKPVQLNGGGNSFTNSNGGVAWAIPELLRENVNGTYSISSSSPAIIVITGIGVVSNGVPVEVNITVTSNNATVSVIH